MLGAVPLGVLAACVVLFVPMGMAGYHLSRNKMLFFSGALFISLALIVHLAPYVSLASLLSLPPSPSPSPPSSSCLPFLHRISFTAPYFSWPRSAASCAFRPLGRADASDLLNGSWILIAGDSQARFLALALLRLVLDPAALPPVEAALFRRHSDYRILIPESGIKIDFVWAPFEANLTDTVLPSLGRPYPDVLVVGSGLWHMLHYTNASGYGESLAAVRRSAEALLSPTTPPDFAPPVIHMFWLGMPTLVSPMLNSEEKRERMNQTTWEEYYWELNKSKILRESGGPLFLLDIGLLSRSCGRRCTEDGMHYNGVVYEAALHIMLNALMIQSQQRV